MRFHRRVFLFGLICLSGILWAKDPAFGPVTSEGRYRRHLQGFCTDQRASIYWCWTDVLVKTDAQGRVLARRDVANHHGDLCYADGRIYVAVNLGKFNQPAGNADSWVYVYDAKNLEELGRHPVPELVHGAGGMAYHDGKFIVVGGLPVDFTENYLYEYDKDFRFLKRHVLASGYTRMGIQTIAWAQGSWWLGCYGSPAILLRADGKFNFTGRWEFNASVGIDRLDDGRFLIATNKEEKKGDGYTGRLMIARRDEAHGLMIERDR